jgi:hypothetical protein
MKKFCSVLIMSMLFSCSTKEQVYSEKENKEIKNTQEVSVEQVVSEVEKDESNEVLLSTTKLMIHRNAYYFHKVALGDYGVALYIDLVKEGDSARVFEDFLYLKGGNCNGRIKLVSYYEVHQDTLFFWSYTENKMLWDVRYPEYSTDMRRETYAIQKKGPIVRLRTDYGDKDSSVWYEVVGLLQESMDTIEEY